MKSLREQALEAEGWTRLLVSVPGWISGYVETWSGLDRQTLIADWIDWRDANGGVDRGGKFYKAFVVARVFLDEEGKRIFTDSDVKPLADKPARWIDAVIFAADKLNALTDDEAEKMLKNCDGSPSSSAGTDLPSFGAAQ